MGAKPRNMFLSSLKMAFATLASRILGLVREQVMAFMFGASGLTDAFTVAYRIPNMLRDLFAEGTFSPAFVPIFTEKRLKNPEEARKLLWSLFMFLVLCTGTLSIFIILFAENIVLFMTDDVFTSDPARLEITVTLVKIMAPFLVFVSLAALFMGALNSLKIFFIPALAPAGFNVIMIASMLVLTPYFISKGMPGIYAMGVGVLGGGFVQFLVQVPLIFKNGYAPIWPKQIFSRAVSRVIKRVSLGTIGIAATQINVLITTILATGTQVGAVSWLNYAFRLFQFPVGILGVSIGGSNLVHFSDEWKSGDRKEAVGMLSASYHLSMLVMLLAFSLMIPLTEDIVRIIFERGRFDGSDTNMTSTALIFYLLGLPSYGLYKVFGPTFFAVDKPKLPIFISVGCILFNIAFCTLLTPSYGFKVLALGTSLSMILNSFIQMIFMKRFLKISYSFFVNLKILKMMTASALSILAIYYSRVALGLIEGTLKLLVAFSGLCLMGSLIYFGIMLLFGEKKLLNSFTKKT